MIKQFINKLSFFEKLVFLTGKFFNKIGNSVLSYKNLGAYDTQYSKLALRNIDVSSNGTEYLYNSNGLKAYSRVTSSDSMVFSQVIVNEEYKALTDVFLSYNQPLKSFLDLGSNIGLASLYIKKSFPDCTVVAVEPDAGNFNMLQKNFELNKLTNVFPLNAGVGKKDCFLKKDEGIRDGKEWSFSFTEVDYPTDIPSYSISTLLNKFSINEIDAIKIDVEGAEKEIFAADADISFLDKVKVLAVEIHDEFEVRNDIYEILKNKNFLIFNTAETTLAVKKDFFKS